MGENPSIFELARWHCDFLASPLANHGLEEVFSTEQTERLP